MTSTHDPKHEWPTVQSATVSDPHLERDAATIALEEEWRNGWLVENEPRA